MRRQILIVLAIIVLIAALAAGYSFLRQGGSVTPPAQNQPETDENIDSITPVPSEDSAPTDDSSSEAPFANTPSNPASGVVDTKVLASPINDATSRVTKKPFGIKVSPASSPVQPERFSGYHTGVDFEILLGEDDPDVPILAVCEGTLIYKNYVSGYGGVLVERCKLDGQDVTVLYGHLRLSSIAKNVGENIKAGERVGVLGTGYGQETAGERKHLHLGIHKGTQVELKGYVQSQTELNQWLDAMKYLS